MLVYQRVYSLWIPPKKNMNFREKIHIIIDSANLEVRGSAKELSVPGPG